MGNLVRSYFKIKGGGGDKRTEDATAVEHVQGPRFSSQNRKTKRAAQDLTGCCSVAFSIGRTSKEHITNMYGNVQMLKHAVTIGWVSLGSS